MRFSVPVMRGGGRLARADMLCIQNPESLSLKEQLNLAISDSLQPPQQHSGTSNLATVIRQEIALFEGGGSRGRHLQFVYDCSLCHLLVSKPRGHFRQRELFAPDYAHDWMMPHSITYAFFGLCFRSDRTQWGCSRADLEFVVHLPVFSRDRLLVFRPSDIL